MYRMYPYQEISAVFCSWMMIDCVQFNNFLIVSRADDFHRSPDLFSLVDYIIDGFVWWSANINCKAKKQKHYQLHELRYSMDFLFKSKSEKKITKMKLWSYLLLHFWWWCFPGKLPQSCEWLQQRWYLCFPLLAWVQKCARWFVQTGCLRGCMMPVSKLQFRHALPPSAKLQGKECGTWECTWSCMCPLRRTPWGQLPL